MKSLITIIFLISFQFVFSQSREKRVMKLEGYYAGKNVVVRNPFLSGGQGFCVWEVKVNGDISTADPNSEIFQVPLDKHNIKPGQFVKIEIMYIFPCGTREFPSVMTPGALLSDDNNKSAKENHLTIEGPFYYQNIMVCNPKENNGHYGVKQVKVNGKIQQLDLDRDVFEIDLMSLGASDANKAGIKDGDKIKIEFLYAKGCDPLILNPEALIPIVENK